MSEESVESPVPGSEPVEEDVGQSTERSSEAANTSEAAPDQEPLASSDRLDTKEEPSSDPVQDKPEEETEEAKTASGEPPVDWFEPLEDDDDAYSVGRNDPDEESLAGESERSESVAGSEKTSRRIYQFHAPRRKRSNPDEGWVEWSVLGEGWKRKEVVRRSGSSIGQKDVYYMRNPTIESNSNMSKHLATVARKNFLLTGRNLDQIQTQSPRGDRVRSRVELISMMEGYLDLTTFDYKTGRFYDGQAQPIRVRNRSKKRVRERSSSESSWMDRGEGADTPDSHQRPSPKSQPYTNQTSFISQSTAETPDQGLLTEDTPAENKIKLPLPSSSSRTFPLPSINGEIGSEENTLICAKCGISFTGTWYDKQRKRPCCPTCWASKTKEHPMIRFRKWIPCGQCVGCHNTVNCGQCANCKHGLQSPDSRKRICRKRKCICPIRKGPGSGGFLQQRPYNDIPEPFDDSMSFQNELTDSQHQSLKGSDTENFSVNVDVDDEDDLSTDDDDDWHKKRKRRSCGECKACLCRKDCGTCDFCIDKPKFGGSNKKRQKCRLRQCQRQAMRHLLPFQMGQGEFVMDGIMLPGRPRPHYTYSRKSGFKKSRGSQFGFDFTDNEDDDFPALSWSADPASGSKHSYELNARNHQSSMQLNHLDFGQRNGLSDRVPYISNHNNSELDQLSRWDAERLHMDRDGPKHVDEEEEKDEEELPMITQIFSLADNSAGTGVDIENQLMKLLHSLRSSVLPILWYAIMVEGPQLQLIQCSKQSSMTDTMVLIDPGFCYQITVQKQPLLPTHPLYEKCPGRLTSVTEVVSLLLGLEKYVVCQGMPPKEPCSMKDPLILERASTCDFLVKRKVSICSNCRALQGL